MKIGIGLGVTSKNGAAQSKIYVVVGDSTRDNSFNRCIDYYNNQLSKIGVQVVDNAASGQSAQDWAANADQTTLQQALDAIPGTGAGAIVEYSLGINDDKNEATKAQVKGWIKGGVEDLIEARPAARVILVVPVYTANTTRNANLQDIYEEIALELSLELIDPLSIMGAVHDDPDFYQDGTHPTVYGSMRLVNFILDEALPIFGATSIALDEDFAGNSPPVDTSLPAVLQIGYWNSSGTYSSNSSWRSLEAIEVEPNFTVRIDHQGNRVDVRLLDEDGVHQGFENTTEVSGETYRELVIPPGIFTLLVNVSSQGATYDALNDTPTVDYVQPDIDPLTQAEINAGVP